MSDDLKERLRSGCYNPSPADCAIIDDMMREAADHIEALEAERDRLSDILRAIEMMTATGDGLSPDDTMNIHIIAAEGRADDPHAWRADQDAINRLRAALKETTDER